MFEMTKWYLDLVTDLGNVLVGHSVDCRLGAAGFRYASLLHVTPEVASTERSTLRGARAPRLEAGLLQDRLGPLAGMRQQKWLTRGSLRQQDAVIDRGWTLHEAVHW
jgi:hypothetical protein